MSTQKKRQRKREIHALEYAVCAAVTLLDHALRGHISGWNVSQGLNITVEKRQIPNQRCVDHVAIVQPVGWGADDFIRLRCMPGRNGGGWWPFEGFIVSHHLPVPQLHFKIEPDLISVESRDDMWQEVPHRANFLGDEKKKS